VGGSNVTHIIMRVNNLKELEKELKKRINNALTNEVSNGVKDVMTDHIISDVYDKYDPIAYTRRLNDGGLLDRDNMLSDLKCDSVLSVKNITLGDKYYTFAGEQRVSQNYNKPIADVVETGEGYDVSGWEYDGVERPFMKNTAQDIKDNHYHTIAMKQGLERQGLEVKIKRG
jgi:hypothetical protein